MNTYTLRRTSPRLIALASLVVAALLLNISAPTAQARSWKGIEPLKSRRTDVERTLGAPVRETPTEGALHFDVMGGRVTVFLVTAQFVASKKLRPEAEGIVLQIVLQHERATETPASLEVEKDKDFEREAKGEVVVYRNLKDGISYTFVGGRLQTTRYSAPAEALAKLFKKG